MSLSVSETKVTPFGLAFFIKDHPKVVRIDHENVFQLFAHFNPSKDDSYNLIKLTSNGDDDLDPRTFEQALDSCPKVENLTVTSPGLSDTNLYRLMTLNYLNTLHLSNNPRGFNQLSFAEGVAPILSQIGPNLKKLVLERFVFVDLTFVGENCPNLLHLALANIGDFASVLQPNMNIFRNLTDMELWCEVHSEVCVNVLKQFLCPASNLTCLLLQNVNSLNDHVFQSILDVNQMLKVKNVVFDQCHGITVIE